MTEPREDIADESKSRERFEKWMNSMPEGTPYCELDIWQAAERDTREWCARQFLTFCTDATVWYGRDQKAYHIVNGQNVAEAIRKGGE